MYIYIYHGKETGIIIQLMLECFIKWSVNLRQGVSPCSNCLRTQNLNHSQALTSDPNWQEPPAQTIVSTMSCGQWNIARAEKIPWFPQLSATLAIQWCSFPCHFRQTTSKRQLTTVDWGFTQFNSSRNQARGRAGLCAQPPRFKIFKNYHSWCSLVLKLDVRVWIWRLKQSFPLKTWKSWKLNAIAASARCKVLELLTTTTPTAFLDPNLRTAHCSALRRRMPQDAAGWDSCSHVQPEPSESPRWSVLLPWARPDGMKRATYTVFVTEIKFVTWNGTWNVTWNHNGVTTFQRSDAASACWNTQKTSSRGLTCLYAVTFVILYSVSVWYRSEAEMFQIMSWTNQILHNDAYRIIQAYRFQICSNDIDVW